MKRQRDRLVVIALWLGSAVTAVAALIAGIKFAGTAAWINAIEASAEPSVAPLAHQEQAKAREVDRRFKEAVVMLHAKQYEHAMTALHRVLELAPKMPEAHVNMGYTMLGLKRYAAARDFFSGAVDLRPMQANAYYGLALALDAQNDRAGALGAMRSFVHLAKADDPFVRKARAALWEWQSADTSRDAGPARAKRENKVSDAAPGGR